MFPLFDENEPGQGIAWVTLALIAVNVAVFLFLQGASGDNQFTYGYSTIPTEIITGHDIVANQPVIIDGVQYVIPEAPGPSPIYLTLLTSMFMHASWLHLGGNMLFLFIFGDNVEHYVGSILYLAFYLVAGIIASFAQILADTTSLVPNLGASGAIAAVLGAYIVLFPRNRVVVLLFRFLVPVPALVAIGLWAVLQFVSGFGSLVSPAANGGVAYLAHVGGFVSGVVFAFLARGFFGDPAARRQWTGR
jgi:membrane associated rhomboid family serine protease